MIKVFLAGTDEDLFQLNMSPAPLVDDEPILNDEPFIQPLSEYPYLPVVCRHPALIP